MTESIQGKIGQVEGIIQRIKGKKQRLWLFLSLAVFLGGASLAKATTLTITRAVPDLGVMLNNDGESFFQGRQADYGRTAPEMLTDLIATGTTLSGSPIKSFLLCTAEGSEDTYYKTEVPGGAPIGWQFGTFIPGTTSTYANSSVIDYARAFLTVTPDPAGQNPWRVSGTDPMDPVYVIATTVKSKGIGFYPSVRMNDAHFANMPWNNALKNLGTHYAGIDPEVISGTGNWDYTTGKFWVDHNGNPLTENSGTSGILSNNRLDFAQQAVRDYRLDMIHEVLERCSGKVAGIELDFTRHGQFFDPTNNAADKALMTAIVLEVRQHLDDLETRSGSTPAAPLYKYLVVRVPPTMYNAQYADLDVASWLDQHDVTQRRWNHTTPWNDPVTLNPTQVWHERLVDVIIPAQTYALASDMPIDAPNDYIAKAAAAGAKVYPCIYERAQYSWPFVVSPTSSNYYEARANRRPTPELIAGAASNYRAMGASGFEMYNYNLPLNTELPDGEPPGPPYLGAVVPALLASGTALIGHDCIYEITPAASPTSDIYNPATYPYLSGWGYQKQMPRLLANNTVASMQLYVGQNLATTSNLAHVVLRLGLVATGTDSKPNYATTVDTQSASIIIKVNGSAVGNTIYNGTLAANFLATSADNPGHPAPESGYPSIPRAYFQVEVPTAQIPLFLQGQNSIDIMVSGNTVPFSLVETQLGVFYNH